MHRPPRHILLALLLALIATVAACTGPARPGATAAESTNAPAAQSPDGTSVPAAPPSDVPDPRSLTGPTTAAAVAPIEPLTPAPEPELPATVTDAKGRAVTVSNADRILALDIYGTLTETVIGLGLGEHLVGRTISTTDPRYAHLTNVTPSGHELNVEAILSLAPTVVLADGTLGPQEVYTQLEQAGVAVVLTDSKRGIELIEPQIQAVAAALGVPESGTALAARAAAELDGATATVASLAPSDPAKQLRLAFLYVRGSGSVFFIFGQSSGADGLITALGAKDVASESGITDYKPATAESLALINPELVLMMTSGISSAGGLEAILARPGMAATTAGTNQRIVDMEDGTVLSFGPNYAQVIISLANAIYLAK